MTKHGAVIFIFLFSALAGCDGIKHRLMHDAPQEPKAICGNSARQNTWLGPEDGKALFMANCATCHNLLKDATGPALQGTLSRWEGDTVRLYAFIRNPRRMIRRDAYAKTLHGKWQTDMPGFPRLTSGEIGAILDYASGAY